MNNKIATGIWFVFIGLIVLLHNLHVFDFNFIAILKYWPLILVSVGISLLFQNKRNATLITISSNLLICSFLLYKGLTVPNEGIFNSVGSENTTYNANETLSTDSFIEFEKDINEVHLEINGGAAKYILSNEPDTSKLFHTWSKKPNIGLELSSEVEDKKRKIVLNSKVGSSKSGNNIIFLSMHTAPVWTIELNIGAVAFEADFSPYRFKKFEINSGASNMNIKFGKPINGITKLEMNTAASNIKIQLPKGVAYKMSNQNILSKNKLEGAIKNKDGDYETENYASAEHKYEIEMNGAANKFTISTY